MFGSLDESQIDDLLNAKLIGRLGLQEDNVPYIVPISYAYDGESIVCHTQEGLKMEMMRKNPLVCFQVDDMDDLSRWKSVICWGNAEEVKDVAERKKADVIVYAVNENNEVLGSSRLVNSEEYSSEGEVQRLDVIIKNDERTEYAILMNKLLPFLEESKVRLLEII